MWKQIHKYQFKEDDTSNNKKKNQLQDVNKERTHQINVPLGGKKGRTRCEYKAELETRKRERKI